MKVCGYVDIYTDIYLYICVPSKQIDTYVSIYTYAYVVDYLKGFIYERAGNSAIFPLSCDDSTSRQFYPCTIGQSMPGLSHKSMPAC